MKPAQKKKNIYFKLNKKSIKLTLKIKNKRPAN
jgi:hypothetical protein